MELLFGGERYGILLEGISSNASVIDNTMDLDNGCNGIRTRNTSATNISLNEINYSRLRSGPVAIFEAAGIAIQNNGSAYLVGNTINSSGYDGRLDRGITASLSQGALYCCNTTDGNLKYSIRFTNNCDRSKYRYNNKQGNYFNGLFIENGSFFGPQPDPRSGPLSPSGNLWEGSLANEPGPKAHARNANSTPSNRFRSIIFTDGCNPPAWPTTILPTQPCGPGFWLNPLTGEFPSQSCLQDPACHIPSVGLRNNPEHYITASDEEIAIGTLDIEVFGAVAEWQGKLYLLKKLIMYPELLGAVTQIDSFYDVNINLNLGKFVNAYNLIFNEASISLSQIATLENLNSIANNLLIELNDLQLAYNNATTEAEQDQLAAEIVLFQAELDLNRTEYFTELAGMLDQQQSFKSSIETILSSITPLGIIQENEKTILALITEFLINDNQNFSTTQISDLQNVANQCPQTGGAIVYWARIILSSFIAETYDDETLCNTMGNLKGVENPSNGNLKHLFKITQNSTQDELILMSEDLYEGLLNVELLSILGNSPLRVWKKVQFNQALSLEGFPTGYYILRVTEENGKSHSFKWINF